MNNNYKKDRKIKKDKYNFTIFRSQMSYPK